VEQKDLFEASADRLPYVECFPYGRKGPKAAVCWKNNIKSYPLKFFKGIKVELDLIYFDFNGHEKSVQPQGETADTILRNAEKILSENKMPPAQCRVVQNSSDKAAKLMRGYGLVASSIYRQSSKKSPLLELLSRTPYPLFLCWQ